MTGGAGFSKDGQASYRNNRSLLAKKAPFQRLKDNIYKGLNIRKVGIGASTVEDLLRIKAKRQHKEKLRRRFFILMRLAIVLILILIVVFNS